MKTIIGKDKNDLGRLAADDAAARASPPTNVKPFTGQGSFASRRSLRKRRKLAGWSAGRPTYSSRWKPQTFDQSISLCVSSASMN